MLKTIDMEVAVSHYFNPRQNLIVPGVHWGLSIHECDLLIITKAGFAYEVEIKISRADLIKDKEKWHEHKDNRIKYLYFAIPEKLEHLAEHIPERAGIIVVDDSGRCKTTRNPKPNQAPYRFSIEEKFKVARLGALRIWGLKRKIIKLSSK